MFRIVCFFVLLLPVTFLHAIMIEKLTIRSIEGSASLLNRPEGIAFSPCGNFVAIANSLSNNVLFFRTSDCLSQNVQALPIFVLTNTFASYPHDLDFSPDGAHLAIASRNNNLILLHKRNAESGFYDHEPFAVIEGSQASLVNINAVKYSPCGNCLGVCDVKGNQIALFRYRGDEYEPIPYQVLQEHIDILDRPDGLAFSSDGKLLAVTSHGVHLLLIYERSPDSQELFNPNVAEIIPRKRSLCTFPHSVCFHPVDDTLVISSAGGRKNISVFQKLADTAPRYSGAPSQIFEIFNPKTIHLQEKAPEEGGVKGIHFSADGKILGFCASDITNTARSIMFYSIEEPLLP